MLKQSYFLIVIKVADVSPFANSLRRVGEWRGRCFVSCIPDFDTSVTETIRKPPLVKAQTVF